MHGYNLLYFFLMDEIRMSAVWAFESQFVAGSITPPTFTNEVD